MILATDFPVGASLVPCCCAVLKLAHAIWTFVVFWSVLVAQLTAMVRLMVMRDSQQRDPHLVQ